MIIEITDVDEIDLEKAFAVFGEAPQYPGQLVVQATDQNLLIRDYPEFISEFSVLIETGLWEACVSRLEEDGYVVYVLPSSKRILDQHRRWSEPLEIEGLHLPARGDQPGGLFPYQQYAVQKALSQPFLFANHGTGTGKSITACALAQELFNRGEIDVVLFFTLRKNKINMMRAYNNFTQLRAVNVEGPKAKRRKEFAKEDADVYVMNYEKANFDFDILKDRVEGKRVLFVFDEVQKILIYTGGKPNKAGQGVNDLLALVSPDSKVLPTSATVINSDPERYFRVFSLAPGKHPLKNITTFRKTFTESSFLKRTPWGTKVEYVWDTHKLKEVRHIVGSLTHTVRKTDPGVRELFKSTEFVPIYIQLSDEDRKLYDLIKDIANSEPEDQWGQYYRILQYICNTAESLKHSSSPIAQEIVSVLPDLSSSTSSKMETLIEQVQAIKDQGDKVVVFTQYTNLGLFLISDELKRAGIKHVVHYGTGMTDKQAQMAQDEFKSDPSVIVFLSSDAGSHGLSFQEAKYVINYDIPYSYDLLMQRNDRIDRADSYLDGLTSYIFITEDTFEERSWQINNSRRQMSAAVQGTTEELARPEAEDLRFLMFG